MNLIHVIYGEIDVKLYYYVIAFFIYWISELLISIYYWNFNWNTKELKFQTLQVVYLKIVLEPYFLFALLPLGKVLNLMFHPDINLLLWCMSAGVLWMTINTATRAIAVGITAYEIVRAFALNSEKGLKAHFEPSKKTEGGEKK